MPTPQNGPHTKGRPIETPMFNWAILRQPPSTGLHDSDNAITDFSDNFDYSDIITSTPPGTAFDLKTSFGNDFGGAMIMFYSLKNDPVTYTPLSNDTFGFQLVGWRSGYGPMHLMVESTSRISCLLGTMKLGTHPVTNLAITDDSLYADTMAINGRSLWAPTVSVADSTNDRICILKIPDLFGIRYLKCYVLGTDGSTANESMNIEAAITTY